MRKLVFCRPRVWKGAKIWQLSRQTLHSTSTAVTNQEQTSQAASFKQCVIYYTHSPYKAERTKEVKDVKQFRGRSLTRWRHTVVENVAFFLFQGLNHLIRKSFFFFLPQFKPPTLPHPSAHSATTCQKALSLSMAAGCWQV